MTARYPYRCRWCQRLIHRYTGPMAGKWGRVSGDPNYKFRCPVRSKFPNSDLGHEPDDAMVRAA